jgi:hypothetical protein
MIPRRTNIENAQAYRQTPERGWDGSGMPFTFRALQLQRLRSRMS